MKQHKPALRVIRGDLDRPFYINGVTLRLAPLEAHLPKVQAVVVEQDTGLLLDETVELKDGSPLGDALTDSLLPQGFDYPVGTLLHARGTPPRLQLVVHDLERAPNWSEAGVERALQALLEHLSRYRIHSLAMPALAHRHGALPVTQFLTLLCDYLAYHHLPWGGELWLLLPREALQASLETLSTLCDIHHP